MAGLANLSEFFENPLFTETIREVPVETGYIGSRFLPSENTYDMEWNETVIERQADMADLVDAGAELPLTDRDPVRRVSGSIADMGQSYILTKKELAAMSDKGNEGRRKMAVQQVLKKTAQLKSNIDARVEWLRWQALGNGAMIYDKSGIKLGVDFGVPEANKVTAATAWGADGATILANYERWVQDYIDGNDNGYAPDVFVTGIENIRIVLNDVAIRKAKVLKTGVTVENAILDVGAVVDMSEKDATRLSGYGLVEVVDEPDPEPEQETPTEDQPDPKKATRTKKTE